MRVSVVVPALNEETYIGKCLEALNSQTIKPYEIIVVDNNSSDSTALVAAGYPNVSVIHEPVRAIYAARNRGFNAAGGDIIARTDADSRPDSNWIETIIEQLQDQNLGAVHGALYYFDLPLQKPVRYLEANLRNLVDKRSANIRFLTGANMAIRSSVWRKVRTHTCKNNKHHEDLCLAIHASRMGVKIVFCRDMSVSTSARRMSTRFGDFYKYIKRFENTYKDHGYSGFLLKIPVIAYSSLQPIGHFAYLVSNPTQTPSYNKAYDMSKSLRWAGRLSALLVGASLAIRPEASILLASLSLITPKFF